MSESNYPSNDMLTIQEKRKVDKNGKIKKVDRGNTVILLPSFLIRSRVYTPITWLKVLSWALPLVWSLIYLCCFDKLCSFRMEQLET